MKIEIKRFIGFKTMVSPQIIECVYLIGVIAITITGFVMIAKGSDIGEIGRYPYFGIGFFGAYYLLRPFIGWGILLFGNLLWRVFCERCVLLFNIHELLASIEQNLNKKGENFKGV